MLSFLGSGKLSIQSSNRLARDFSFSVSVQVQFLISPFSHPKIKSFIFHKQHTFDVLSGYRRFTKKNKGVIQLGKPTLTNDGSIRFPLGLTINRWFKVKEFFLPLPVNLDFYKVKEFTILPKNGEFYLECSYETPKITVELDVNQALSIDLGTSSNLMACVDTLGNSFLVDHFLNSKFKIQNE